MVWVTARGTLQGLQTKPRRNELQGGRFRSRGRVCKYPWWDDTPSPPAQGTTVHGEAPPFPSLRRANLGCREGRLVVRFFLSVYSAGLG